MAVGQGGGGGGLFGHLTGNFPRPPIFGNMVFRR